MQMLKLVDNIFAILSIHPVIFLEYEFSFAFFSGEKNFHHVYSLE